MLKQLAVILALLYVPFSSLSYADNALGEEAYAKGQYDVALIEFKDAAENGDMYAQFNMGVLYEHGHGVAQSDMRAAEWYQLAEDNGHPEAALALQLLYEYF